MYHGPRPDDPGTLDKVVIGYAVLEDRRPPLFVHLYAHVVGLNCKRLSK